MKFQSKNIKLQFRFFTGHGISDEKLIFYLYHGCKYTNSLERNKNPIVENMNEIEELVKN
jgi:hypothetical protein